jgi:hypothetical protein
MQARQLQLVLPEQIHGTYTQTQQQWLMSVHDFLEHVQFNQRRMTIGESHSTIKKNP